MALDDVIAQKNKTVAELDKKIAGFKAEIERLTKATKDKRAELLAEGSKTVSSLNAGIPPLRSEKARLESEVNQLNKTIKEKLDASKKADENAVAHYKNLEDLLLKEYEKKHSELNKHSTALHGLSDTLNKQAEGLKQQGDKLNASINTHEADKATHADCVGKHENYRKDMLSKITNDRFRANNLIIQADARQKESLESEKRSAIRENAVIKREKKCEEVLARINEANDILAQANEKELANKNKEEQLNQQAVQLKADRARLANKEDAVILRESEVKKREENIKILEAKHG